MNSFSVNSTDLFSILVYFSISFLIAWFATPFLTDFLYKNRIGKKIRDVDYASKKTPIFSKLHQAKENTPTLGGVLIWGTASIVTFVANFTRTGTLLPVFTLIALALLALSTI